jgi:phage-related protein
MRRAETPALIWTSYNEASEPENRKPMKTVGPGVKELRVRDSTGAYRVIYLATHPEAAYVLRCF